VPRGRGHYGVSKRYFQYNSVRPEFAQIGYEESTYMHIICDNNEKLEEKGCLSTKSKQPDCIYVCTVEWKIDLKFDYCSSV
jgi:hypothetical protein